MSEQIQRFAGSTDGLAFHEPVVIVYARELNALEARLSKAEAVVRALRTGNYSQDDPELRKALVALAGESE